LLVVGGEVVLVVGVLLAVGVPAENLPVLVVVHDAVGGGERFSLLAVVGKASLTSSAAAVKIDHRSDVLVIEVFFVGILFGSPLIETISHGVQNLRSHVQDQVEQGCV